MPQVDLGVERDFFCVNPKNLLAAIDIGRADGNLTVEPAWAQQRRIVNVRPVRRSDDNNALVGREAVHLDEQLVERLLALLVAQRVPAAAPADGVELVDEHDAGGMAPRVFEEFSDARCADAGVHLDEV